MNWAGWVSSLRLEEEKVVRMNPPVMRFINTETTRAGKMEEEVIKLEEVCMEPVLSDKTMFGEDMLDLMELTSSL